MEISIQIKNDEVTKALAAIRARLGNMAPAMRKISGDMHDAVEENFAQQGRPRWKPSRRAEKEGGMTLQDTGRLAASITRRSTNSQAIVGTNVKYAAIHQFGGRTRPHGIFPKNRKALKTPFGIFRKVRHPGSKIPARPFLSLADDDLSQIMDVMARYITGGK